MKKKNINKRQDVDFGKESPQLGHSELEQEPLPKNEEGGSDVFLI